MILPEGVSSASSGGRIECVLIPSRRRFLLQAKGTSERKQRRSAVPVKEPSPLVAFAAIWRLTQGFEEPIDVRHVIENGRRYANKAI